ncbi:MAG: NAD(P)H-dependent oxidoreductase [Rhodobacteraceae bacterium]|nr:NAD(P)H-dependent oxidoreductase [Paracoccaceae bacterium]
MSTNILRVDSSARKTGSVSRDLTDRIIARFEATGETNVVTRDLTTAIPQIDEEWIGANFTPANDRSDAQNETQLSTKQRAGHFAELGSSIAFVVHLRDQVLISFENCTSHYR